LEELLGSSELCLLLQQALILGEELQRLKSEARIAEPVEYILVASEDGVNARFHLVRPGQNWLADDLEKYEEAVGSLRLP
jgi:hypothetical protein